MESCVAFAAYGWLAHIQWLVAAGVTIGLGEFAECTYYLIVLSWGERSRRIDILSDHGEAGWMDAEASSSCGGQFSQVSPVSAPIRAMLRGTSAGQAP